MHIQRVKELLKRITLNIIGIDMNIQLYHDKIHNKVDGIEPRVYLQIDYFAPDTKEGIIERSWRGGKWYLSPYMTDDEIIKKCYLAFRTVVEHEVLEGFVVDGVTIFSPHRNFEDLIKLGRESPDVERKQIIKKKIW